MRGNPQEEIGRVYGRLTVIALAEMDKAKRRRYLCRCICGKEKVVQWYHLKKRLSRSCGCYMRERAKDANTVHGEAGARTGRVSTEYRIWTHIIGRCENPKDKAWPYYGGRGISICQKWRQSFLAFLADVGRRPSPHLSIDRIDNNGNYEPGNIRWATKSQQALNRRPKKRVA